MYNHIGFHTKGETMMKDVLNTIEINFVPVTYGKIYLNVPAGNYSQYNVELIKLVEKIGEKCGTVTGSKLKKGIHYIQSEIPGTSKRQIKMILRNVQNALIHDHNESLYVYRCSKQYYANIIKLIIETAKERKPGVTNTDWLIPTAKKGIKYVSVHGISEEIRTEAENLLNKVLELDYI